MYVNPWKYEVGDLVGTRDEWTGRDLTGVIIDRRRRDMYVEARPIRCIEIDEYCVVSDNTQYWIPEESLKLFQARYPAAAGADVGPSGGTYE